MPNYQGIDNAIDRLFKRTAAEKLAEVGQPEELNPRFSGAIRRIQPGGGEGTTPQTAVVPPTAIESPPSPPPPPPPFEQPEGEKPPPSPLERGLQWLNAPFAVPGAMVKEAEKTALTEFNPKWGVNMLKAPEEISKIVNRPETEVKDWLPGGKKYQEYWDLPIAEQVKYELPLWIATFALPTGGAARAALLATKAAKSSKLARTGMEALAVLYKAQSGELALEPFKFAGKGISQIKKLVTPKVIQHTDPLLNDVLNSVRKPPPLPKTPVKEKIGKLYTDAQRQITDTFVVGKQMSSRVKAKLGGDLPYEIDFATQSQLLPGVTYEARQMAQDTFGNVLRTVNKDKGLLDYVDSYLILRHQADVIASHPKRVFFGGKTVENIQAALTDMKQGLGDGTFKMVEDAASVVKRHYDDILAMDLKAGLVDEELATLLRTQYPWYNPIQYYRDSLNQIAGGRSPLSVTANAIRRLTELGKDAAQEKPLNTLLEATMNRMSVIRRNEAAKALVKLGELDDQFGKLISKAKITRPVAQEEGKLIFRPVKGEVRGTISFLENGKRVAYDVPPELERMAKFLSDAGITSLDKFFLGANAVPRAGITGMNLVFSIGNFGIDTLATVINRGVSPLRIVKRLALNFKDLVKEDKLLRDLRLNRGEVSGFSGVSQEKLSKMAREASKGKGVHILETESDWKRLMNPKNILHTLEEIGHAVELAPRSALYERELGRGVSKPLASSAARKVTVDFSMMGEAMRHANAMYLYLNPGVQGTLLPFRALRDHPVSRYMLAGYAALTASNYAWNRQFPEYQDVPSWAKYGGNAIMLPSEEYDARGNKVPHYITIIPNLREYSAFSAPILYALEKLDKKNPEDVGTFLKDLAGQLNPLSSIVGTGGGGVIKPPTQFFSTVSEIAQNNDPFKDRPIVSPELEGKPLPEQYDQYTSQTARKMGELLNQSPLKIDYALKNILGGLGQTFTSGIDAVINYIEPDNTEPRIADLYHELDQIKPPNIPPEEVKLKRDEFLSNLTVADRQAVLDLERRPEPVIPLITPMMRKLYKEYGGQIYKTGEQLAADLTGVSVKRTKEASQVLGQFSQTIDVEQEKLDNAVRDGIKTMQDWRNERNVFADMYKGALLSVGIAYPSSAQADPAVWDDYVGAVYTLASSMPDIRTRGDILKAGYYAIRPEEDPATMKMDWDEFYQRRDEFKSILSSEDKQLLESVLKSRLSPLEKTYFDIVNDNRLSAYYKLPEGKYRALFREIDPDFDAMLNMGGFVTTVRTPKALALLKQKADAAGIPFEKTMAVQGIMAK